MDIFKFNSPTTPTKLEYGELITGLTKKTWIERYYGNGEFTLEAPLRTGIRTFLPEGTLISHTNTKEVMIVEDHQVKGTKGDEAVVVVTGKSFETWLSQRIVGLNQVFPVTDIHNFVKDNHYSWNHIVDLIKEHILAEYLLNDDYALPFVSVEHTVTNTFGAKLIPIEIPRGSVYEHVLNLLKIDNLGIKIVRPTTDQNLHIVIHRGTDRSHEVVFSYEAGELEDMEYLFSNQKEKNAALVSGTWVEFLVEGPEVGYERRMMLVDALDVDDELDVPPEPGYGLDLVKLALWLRGVEVLKQQKEIALKKADAVKSSVNFVYRRDYDLGDLVGVNGGYLTTDTEPKQMRVIEFLEAEDENGQFSYPTLSVEEPVVLPPVDLDPPPPPPPPS